MRHKNEPLVIPPFYDPREHEPKDKTYVSRLERAIDEIRIRRY